MSEKRFELIEDDLEPLILDNKETMSVNEVVDLLNEQQATIKKLQDLCGQSDSENAKLRIENKEQQATINELKERNAHNFAQNIQLKKQIKELKEENGQLRRLFEEMKQPITINLTEEDEKELRKLLGLIDDERRTKRN